MNWIEVSCQHGYVAMINIQHIESIRCRKGKALITTASGDKFYTKEVYHFVMCAIHDAQMDTYMTAVGTSESNLNKG